MLDTLLIKLRTNFSETIARRLLIPILVLFLTLILSSCASVAPQQDKPIWLAIPAIWSNATDADADADADVNAYATSKADSLA